MYLPDRPLPKVLRHRAPLCFGTDLPLAEAGFTEELSREALIFTTAGPLPPHGALVLIDLLLGHQASRLEGRIAWIEQAHPLLGRPARVGVDVWHADDAYEQFLFTTSAAQELLVAHGDGDPGFVDRGARRRDH